VVEDIFAQKYRVLEILHSSQSKYQKVDVVRTAGHGVMLFLDGLVMVSDRDEFIYHDMIVHVPLHVHPDPKRVLVIGGGDGGTAREVLRHPGVEECVMIEIDEMVIEVSKQFIPVTASSFDHPKLDLRIEDGVKFMAETDERFDVILIDSTDPIGPAKPLFGPDFYANVARVLNDQGIVVAQGESTFYEVEMQKMILQSVREHFSKVHMFNYSNLTYPSGQWSFVYASKGLCPLGDFDEQRAAMMQCRYYNPGLHKGAFALSQFQLDQVGYLLSDFSR
jgi:spermidine synthase